MGKDDNGVNIQVHRAVIRDDLQGGVAVGGIIRSEDRFDFFRVLGLVFSEIPDIAKVLSQFRHIISLVDPDIQPSAASKLKGVITVSPVFSTAWRSDDLIGSLAKKPLNGLLQRLCLFFAVNIVPSCL